MRISDWSSDVCSSDLAAGDSEAAAAATKSDITASTDTPAPTIKIPVWPVARKSAAIERRRNSRSIASAVYILPTAQSAPTVINRLPGRRSNTPIANRCVGRSEERRVGQECVSTCISRGPPDHYNIKKQHYTTYLPNHNNRH